MDQQAPAEVPRASGDFGLRSSLSDLVRILSMVAVGAVVSWLLQDRGISVMAGMVIGFAVCGLRAAPGRLFRSVAKAYGACAAVLMAASLVHLLWLAYGSARSDYVYGKEIDWAEAIIGYGMAGPFFMAVLLVNVLPFALLGGGLAWLIRRWRPARSRSCAG